MIIDTSALSRLDWRQTLSLLHGKPVPALLPSSAFCPLCEENAAAVYASAADLLYADVWFHCQRCSFAGDLYDLAASSWRIDHDEAVQKLAEAGCVAPPAELELVQYKRQKLRQAKLLALYQKCLQRVPENQPQAEQVLIRLGFLTATATRKHSYQRIGWMPAEELHELEREAGALFTVLGDLTCRVGGALVFPHWTFPNQLASLQLLWSDGVRPYRADILPARPAVAEFNQPTRYEGGLQIDASWLHVAERVPTLLIHDAMLTAWLMYAHARHPQEPLPVAGWRSLCLPPGNQIQTQRAWQLIQHKQPVFYMPRLDGRILLAAMQHDGALALRRKRAGQTTRHDIAEAATKGHMSWVRQRLQRSRHWQEVVSHVLLAATDAQLQQCLQDIVAAGNSVDEFLTQIPAHARDRLQRLHKSSAGTRVSFVGGGVIQRRAGWIWEAGLPGSHDYELITDAPFRVDETLVLPASDTAVYRGVVTYQDQVLPFRTDSRELTANTAEWLRKLVRQQAKAEPVVSEQHASRLLSVSLQLHKPRVRTAYGTLGWDESLSAFVLPPYILHADGSPVAMCDTELLDPSLPLLSLPLDTAELSGLQGCKQLAPFVDTLGAVTLAMLLPVFGQPVPAVLTYGPNAFFALQEWLRYMRLPVLPYCEVVSRQAAPLRWSKMPLPVLEPAMRSLSFSENAAAVASPVAIQIRSAALLLQQALLGQHLCLHSALISRAAHKLPFTHMSYCLAAYLKHVLPRLSQLTAELPGGDLAGTLLADFKQTVQAYVGKTAWPLASLSSGSLQDRAAWLQVLFERLSPKTKANTRVVSKQAFFDFFSQRRAAAPSAEVITALLLEADALLEETADDWTVTMNLPARRRLKLFFRSRLLDPIAGAQVQTL